MCCQPVVPAEPHHRARYNRPCASAPEGSPQLPQAIQAELEAILHGAAVAPLSAPGYEAFARGFLRITGSDATRWLNGMVTNSVQALAPGEGNYNFLLNAQGRIQADCTIFRESGEGQPTFLLETDNSQLATVQETLDKYIIMDDVELQICPKREEHFAIYGPQANELLHLLDYFDHLEVDVALLTDSTPPFTVAVLDGAENWFAERVGAIPRFSWDSLLGLSRGYVATLIRKGAVEVSPAALEAFRIYSGTPRYGQDIRNSETARDLPQETNQPQALHFSKGCYLGQEIVERIRSRGQVHRLFTRFRLQGDLPAAFPAPLTVEGKPAGELTSAALVPLPKGPQLLALGYARREFLQTGTELTYPEGTAAPRPASERTDT